MEPRGTLILDGEKWIFAAAEPGPYEWNDPDNPGAPGNYLQRGANETTLDFVDLVVTEGGPAIINAKMIRETKVIEGAAVPTGKWVLGPGDPGHEIIGNGRTVEAAARGVRGQVALVEIADVFPT